MESTIFTSFPENQVRLSDPELSRRRQANLDYIMRLKNGNLLQNFLHEAGLNLVFGSTDGIERHGGWEDPFCQLRGHFLGHWLSAAGRLVASTGDAELRAKADKIVSELARCQEANGGEWVASIPEKYLDFIAKGRSIWAPHYTIHKTLMGLMDYYEFTGNRQALEIADNFSKWFTRWTAKFTREQFDDILDVETGGMLEVWTQLYAATGKAEHRALMDKYYRGRLFDALLRGEDVLTNMHANTTIPEVMGAARAYEVTGEEKWLKIVEAYWDFAVTRRGTYVTGGQTCGEIWSPMLEMNLRLGEKNQEHCVVYNMMRLAEFLLRHTGKAEYAEYWEKNLYNGVMAQTYWDGSGDRTNGKVYDHPMTGLLTYFLPLKGGSRKFWASETGDFFCCHGSLVQANAALEKGIFYRTEKGVAVCQYFGASLETALDDHRISISMRRDTLSGTHLTSSRIAGRQHLGAQVYDHDPNKLCMVLHVDAEKPFALSLRVPQWCAGAPVVRIDGEAVPAEVKDGYITIEREFKDCYLSIEFQKGIRAVALPGDESRVAFTNGPEVLAGLCDAEYALYAEPEQAAETLLEPFNEREWGNWKQTFRTVGQDRTIEFTPLWRVGYDSYTVYFPIRRK